MKKIIASLLALTFMLTFVACGSGASSSSAPAPSSSAPISSAPSASSVPATGGGTYADILKAVRPADYNDAYAIVTADGYAHDPNSTPASNVEDSVQILLEMTSFDVANCTDYALSVSLMNVRAYALGIFKPAEGKEADVKASIDAYVTAQQKAFETYLPDQYENAKNAQVRTTKGGEIILVMDENAAAQADAIEAALQA